MKHTIGFSPCPNDTFIFDALVNHKIDTGDFQFEAVLEDVQTLNEWAMQGKLDITKISYGVLPLVLDKYIVLNAGGALGKGVGPLLIKKNSEFRIRNSEEHNANPKSQIPNSKIQIPNSQFPIPGAAEINNLRVAIPGEHTTAHMLFSLAFPGAKNKYFIIFSDIEEAVLNGEADAGVIIHENRFTYQQKGLHRIVDLGEYWEQQTGLPIPLGGIVAKRNIDSGSLHLIEDLIRKSIQYSFTHYPDVSGYVKQHSQEMEEQVMRQHIDLYVNNYSLDLGEDGKKAVEQFLKIYGDMHSTGIKQSGIFLS